MLKLEQGRPADTSGRQEKEIRVYDFLDKLGVISTVPKQRMLWLPMAV